MRDTITSKKLWFSVGAIAAMFGFALMSAKITMIGPMFDSFVGGVVAITGLFLTGNVANKWIAGREERLATPPTKTSVKSQPLALEDEPELDDSPPPK